jgi:choline kinase
MKAAILTAGRALRLRPHTDERPKALLPVAEVPILRRAIASLLRNGFDQLVIGTGYRAPMIRAAVAEWFPGLEVAYVDNPDFATTYNARSLSLLRGELDGQPFLLLDDDVVFDDGVIEVLLERGPDSIAVRSVGGICAEEVKIHADSHDRVVQIGADLPLRGAMGESVGVALFSGDTSRRLFEALDRRVAQPGGTDEYYEAAIQEVVDGGATLFGVDIGTLYAMGIDTYADLRAASGKLATRPFDDRSQRIAI